MGRGSAPPSTTPTTDGIVAAVIQEGTRRGIDTRWLKDDVVALYQDLHRHPELSGQEHRTQRGVAEALAGTRADLHECAGTGLVAMLRNGPGPVVWLHFDTDALPLTEQTGLPYAGTERATLPDGQVVGVMHACGHDVHTAALVGCLRQLDRDRAGWRGTVVGSSSPPRRPAAVRWRCSTSWWPAPCPRRCAPTRCTPSTSPPPRSDGSCAGPASRRTRSTPSCSGSSRPRAPRAAAWPPNGMHRA